MKASRTLILCGLAALVSSGCATKKFVTREVGAVNQKTDALASQLEGTQERVKRTEARIDEVDREAQAGILDARRSAGDAMTRATEAEKAAKGKLIYTVTLSDDQVKFPFGRAEIDSDAKSRVDQAIAALKTENRGVYFEIHGHTDSTGPSEYNRWLGEQRALMVRDYLHEEHGIALARLAVVSYGETQPVVDNKTPEHRAENRRVVIQVLE
ncbi:MAG TPA: OmpA family protein [Vicinamibacteria bacterium]|nr:OmpA family protein [Vicinamibacteria bacterium]